MRHELGVGQKGFALPSLKPILLRGASVAAFTGLAAWVGAQLFSHPLAIIAGGLFLGGTAAFLTAFAVNVAKMRDAAVERVMATLR